MNYGGGSRKALITRNLLIVCGVVALAIALPMIQSAREKAQVVGTTASVSSTHSFEHPVHPFAHGLEQDDVEPDQEPWSPYERLMYKREFARIQAEERHYAEAGEPYLPHVHMPDGRRLMVQNEQMARMAVTQERGYCVSTEHLPPRFPEGSETGCECGATCDENGKPTNPEGDTCKRHCSRALCKCGTCI